jgi:Uma2 family endonuclease
MTTPARKPATYDDLLHLPAHVVGELVGGELIASPRPASPHAHAASVIGMDLGAPFQRGRGGPGGWWLVYEPELHLGADVLVPDFAGWRVERMPAPPVDVPFYAQVPDWVCEVTSPSTSAIDRVRKMPIYATAGVDWIWLVDPRERLLEAFQNQDGRWLRVSAHSGDENARIQPFDAVPLELGALWLSSPPIRNEP